MFKLTFRLLLVCILSLCISGANADTTLPRHQASLNLLQAAKQGDIVAVRAALKAGANPNAADASGTTALEYAGLQGRLEAAVDNAVSRRREPSYNLSADFDPHPERRFDLIKELIAHNANVKVVKDPKFAGATVGAAFESHRYDVAQLFLARGAGKGSLGFQELLGSGEPRQMKSDPIQRHLFEKLLAQTHNRADLTNVLFFAIGSFDGAYFVRRLIEKGIDPNIREYTGSTPLIAAVRQQKVDVVVVLLKAGANPSLRYVYVSTGYPVTEWQEANGKAPLDFAIAGGNQTLIQILKRLAPNLRGF